MLRRSIFEQHDVPAPPVGSDHIEKMLVFPLGPVLGDQQLDIPRSDVDRSMKDSAGMAAANRNAHLPSDVPITGVQRRRLGNDGFIEQEEHGAPPLGKPVF
jgi:hypothetical protein